MTSLSENESFLSYKKSEASPDPVIPFEFLSLFPGGKNYEKFQIFDFLATIFCFLFFNVGLWRGAFGILYHSFDLYELSFIYLIGSLMNVYFLIMKDSYDKYLNKRTFSHMIFKILYMYTNEMGLIFHWAGLWFTLDYFIGLRIQDLAFSCVGSGIVLLFLGCLVNLVTYPFTVPQLNRKCISRLKNFMCAEKGSKVDSLFVLDALFSVFVVGCLVVFVWRGVWCIFDIYLYPNDEVFSAVISLILGYATVLIIFSIQNFMKKWCSDLTGFWRLAVLDVYVLVSFLGTINVWRGIWNLINIYFLPESPALSCWITHFGCFLFLVLINCSNTLLVRGVAVDGEEEGGQCAVFPTSYLRVLCTGSDRKETDEVDQTTKSKNDVTL